MKKIILFLILFIPCLAFSQSGYYNKLFVRDSIYSTSGIANFSEYYKNGVPFSSGGGDVYLGNRQTFTKRNVFNDTILANGYAEFDNLKLTNYIYFLGDVISDLGFLKGGNVKIGTLDNYSLMFGVNNDTSIIIGNDALILIKKATTFESSVYSEGTVTSNTGFYGNGANVTSINASNLSSGTVSDSRLSSNVPLLSSNNLTITGYLTADTLRASSNLYFIGTDSVVSTSIFKIKNKSLVFEDSDGAKKATLSTNSSGDLVISTNRAVAITGDLEISGWTTLGGTDAIKTKVVKGKTPSSGSASLDLAHSLDHRNIISWSAMVRDSALRRSYVPGGFYGTGTLFYVRMDSLNCHLETGGTATDIYSDSVFFYITYKNKY